MKNKYFLILISLFLSFSPVQILKADEVASIQVTPKLKVSGSYRSGDEGMEAVLIIHGFLQSERFNTVARLADGLVFDGYNVLTPTLSLGINNRKNSLKCNSLHLHTMEDSAKEINLWIDWLVKKGHKKIYLVGHSFGNLNLLSYFKNYANQDNQKHIAKLIMVSLTTIQGENLNQLIEQAKMDDKKANNKLNDYQLVHCNPYKTLPKHFLSYATWYPNNIIDVMTSISIEKFVLIGSKDKRVYDMPDKDFYNKMQSYGTKVVRVEGANHFFDNQFEHILNDHILEILAAE